MSFVAYTFLEHSVGLDRKTRVVGRPDIRRVLAMSSVPQKTTRTLVSCNFDSLQIAISRPIQEPEHAVQCLSKITESADARGS